MSVGFGLGFDVGDKEPIPQPKRTKEMRDMYGVHHNTLGMWKGGLGQHHGV